MEEESNIIYITYEDLIRWLDLEEVNEGLAIKENGDITGIMYNTKSFVKNKLGNVNNIGLIYTYANKNIEYIEDIDNVNIIFKEGESLSLEIL